MIPHNKPWITEADQRAVDEVLTSGYIGQGPAVEALEADIVDIMGGGSACVVSSGTAALFLALLKSGIGRGDGVAVPTYACSALLNAVALTGATPQPVDVNSDDFNMASGKIATQAAGCKAVIGVHTYGAICDIAALGAQGRIVIEDACHTMIERSGTTSAAHIYSFYATKPLAGGHGGAIWSRNRALIEEIRDYREFDRRPSWAPRFNLQMTDIQAGLVRSQLGRRGEILSRRRKIYDLMVARLPKSFRAQAGIGSSSLPYRCVFVAPGESERDRLIAHCRACEIQAIVPLERYELLHRYLGLSPEAFPVAEALVDRTVSLPLYPALAERDIERIASCLEGFH